MTTGPAAVDLTHGGPQRGWLMPYLVEGDYIFGHGRFKWWFQACAEGALPAAPIPQIEFRSAGEHTVRPDLADLSREVAEKGAYKGPPLSPVGARKHLEDLVARMGGGWEAMLYLVRWLAWGLGLSGEEPRAYGGCKAEWDELLKRDFHLQRLVAADADVLGDMLAERHGSGWNPNAFYPTPMEVCACMVKMVMHDVGAMREDGRDARLASVMDPCCGTGRMLLAASNGSVNLWGCDIDQTMVDVCSINLALFAPWGVYLPPHMRALLGRTASPSLGRDQNVIGEMDATRQAQGHAPLPATDVTLDAALPSGEPAPHAGEVVRTYTYNRHGQGELFSVPPRKETVHDDE